MSKNKRVIAKRHLLFERTGTYLLGMQVSTGFAKLNIGVAFATLFRNSSYTGISPKKVTKTLTQTFLIV